MQELVELRLELDSPHLGLELRVEVKLLAAEQVRAVLQPAARTVLPLKERRHRRVARTALEVEHTHSLLVLLAGRLLRGPRTLALLRGDVLHG